MTDPHDTTRHVGGIVPAHDAAELNCRKNHGKNVRGRGSFFQNSRSGRRMVLIGNLGYIIYIYISCIMLY